jgi:hypothetical protein
VRCLIGICSHDCGFWAIGHLPLAQASVTFVLVADLRHHRRGAVARRTACARAAGPPSVMGFVGVLVIVRPAVQRFSTGRWSHWPRL